MLFPRAATVMLEPQIENCTVDASAASSPRSPVGSEMPAIERGVEPSPTMTPLMLTSGLTPPEASQPPASASKGVPDNVKPTNQTTSDPVGISVPS